MQLKVDQTVRKRQIRLEVETTNFSRQELMALDELGEPVISIEKMYLGKYPVSFSKTIRTGFKLRVSFDGQDDIEEAAEAMNIFYEELKTIMRTEMEKLMDTYDDINYVLERKSGLDSL